MHEGDFGDIRETIRRSKSEKLDEQRRRAKSVDPWPVFSYDASRYVDYFGNAFPQIRLLSERFAERKERGERVIVVDVFGIADAHSLGADHTFGLILTKGGMQKSSSTLTVVAGDVFKAKDVKNFIDILDQEQTKISCVFFKPVGALLEYPASEHTYEKLYALLKKLYDRLAANGEVYIGAIGFATETAALVKTLNDFAGVQFCESGNKQADGSRAEEYAHLVKSPSAPAVLPESTEILKRFTELNRTHFERRRIP